MTQTLAGLIARRLTHELAGPVGVIATGVEMLGGDDGEIRALITDGAAALVASLRLHRFVLAPPEIAPPEVADAAHGLLAAWVATREALMLDWQVVAQSLDADRAAVLLGLAMLAAEAAPGGGALTVADEGVTIFARRIIFDADVAAALGGAPVVRSRAALAGLVHAAATAIGVGVEVEARDGALRLAAYQGSALPR